MYCPVLNIFTRSLSYDISCRIHTRFTTLYPPDTHTQILNRIFAHVLTHSFELPHSFPPSLPPSLPTSLPTYLPPSLPPSLPFSTHPTHSYKHSPSPHTQVFCLPLLTSTATFPSGATTLLSSNATNRTCCTFP